MDAARALLNSTALRAVHAAYGDDFAALRYHKVYQIDWRRKQQKAPKGPAGRPKGDRRPEEASEEGSASAPRCVVVLVGVFVSRGDPRIAAPVADSAVNTFFRSSGAAIAHPATARITHSR